MPEHRVGLNTTTTKDKTKPVVLLALMEHSLSSNDLMPYVAVTPEYARDLGIRLIEMARKAEDEVYGVSKAD